VGNSNTRSAKYDRTTGTCRRRENVQKNKGGPEQGDAREAGQREMPAPREPIKRDPIKREPISRTPNSRTGDEGAEPEGMKQRYQALVYRIKPGMSRAEAATIPGSPDQKEKKDLGKFNPAKAGQTLEIWGRPPPKVVRGFAASPHPSASTDAPFR